MSAGYCSIPEMVTIRGGGRRKANFPAGFALIEHPRHGLILFDTGYSSRFYEQTRRFPERLYAMVTPVEYLDVDAASRQLRKLGFDPADVAYVVLSHLHADHVAGLADFPQARIICKREAYDAMRGNSRLRCVIAGFLRGLLPDEDEWQRRLLPIEASPKYDLPAGCPFTDGYDLFGDGSLIAVDLPGHAHGQIGLFLATSVGEMLLCADAVWSSRAFIEERLPSAYAMLIMDNRVAYVETFSRLCQLHRGWPQLRIVPSHCGEALRNGGLIPVEHGHAWEDREEA